MFLLMSYFVLGNVYWTFNLQAVFCLFENLKMFYLMDGLDGLDGLDGWDGPDLCPLKIFILCTYIDKVYTYIYM